MENSELGAGVAGPGALVVVAPCAGTVVALPEVPDPVFAQGMMGPGLAIAPAGGPGCLVAPCAGTVISLFPHAFIIEAPGSRAVLVHAGIDTVELEGEGFETLAAVGAAVEPGQELIRWDPAQVAAKGLSPLVPVIATQAAAGAVELLAAPGGDVAAGAPLLTWA